jgi:hypothetical protein
VPQTQVVDVEAYSPGTTMSLSSVEEVMPRPDDRSPPIAILMNDWIGWWERPFVPALLADSEAPGAGV